MKISIIVPAFNEEALISASLGHIIKSMEVFASRGWQAELIVCDNNSTDRTAELAGRAGARVVFEKINQIARARNAGAAAATGEWLLFVDADCQPTPELFEAAAREMGSGDCLAGGSTVRLAGGSVTANAVTALWNWISRTFTYVAGSFIFCRAEAFRQAGGFNTALFAAEELDLCKKLKPLARARGQRVTILTGHPLLTSDRKLRLYTPREHLVFLARTVMGRGKTLQSRDACLLWYDGRR